MPLHAFRKSYSKWLNNLEWHWNWNSQKKTTIRVILDGNLKFDVHIKSLCRNTILKLGALCQIDKYPPYYQNLLFVNSIIKSHFTYCPLIWMFCLTTSNNYFIDIHGKALRLVPCNYNSYFYEILQMPNEKTMHQKNPENLAKEILNLLTCYSLQ